MVTLTAASVRAYACLSVQINEQTRFISSVLSCCSLALAALLVALALAKLLVLLLLADFCALSDSTSAADGGAPSLGVFATHALAVYSATQSTEATEATEAPSTTATTMATAVNCTALAHNLTTVVGGAADRAGTEVAAVMWPVLQDYLLCDAAAVGGAAGGAEGGEQPATNFSSSNSSGERVQGWARWLSQTNFSNLARSGSRSSSSSSSNDGGGGGIENEYITAGEVLRDRGWSSSCAVLGVAVRETLVRFTHPHTPSSLYY